MRTIQIYDTTLRDGSQGEGVNFSLEDKLRIAQKLDSMGFDFIEGGYPLSNEKDTEFFRRAAELDFKPAKVCAFGMTRRRGKTAAEDPGMQALVASEAPVLTIVGKTSAFHVTEVLRVSREENLDMIRDTVSYLVGRGHEVFYDAEHFFDGWKLDEEYARQTLQAAAEAGATMVILCDTNGGSMPEEISALTRAAAESLSIPIGIHCHNDCDLAVANSLAAIDAGAVQVQGTINGVGERCGNADLISVIANLGVKKQGFQVLGTGGVGRLTHLSRYVYETANMNFRTHQPFVGASAFAHKGGMHVHAVARATESYEHIAPETVGNERRFLVSELSGRSNIVALATKHRIEQDDALMSEILAEVVRKENDGYQFEAAEASFDLLVKKCAGSYRPFFKRMHYHVNVEYDRHGELTTEATVKIQVDEDNPAAQPVEGSHHPEEAGIRHTVAEGDGPVNALDAALRKALNGTFPNLAGMQLVDYKVRVINSGAGTAARVRVVIESRDEQDVWGTVGVSENIIEASWMALVDSIEYKIYKDLDSAVSERPAASERSQQAQPVSTR